MVIDFNLRQDAEIYITPSSYNYGKQVDILTVDQCKAISSPNGVLNNAFIDNNARLTVLANILSSVEGKSALKFNVYLFDNTLIPSGTMLCDMVPDDYVETMRNNIIKCAMEAVNKEITRIASKKNILPVYLTNETRVEISDYILFHFDQYNNDFQFVNDQIGEGISFFTFCMTHFNHAFALKNAINKELSERNAKLHSHYERIEKELQIINPSLNFEHSNMIADKILNYIENNQQSHTVQKLFTHVKMDGKKGNFDKYLKVSHIANLFSISQPKLLLLDDDSDSMLTNSDDTEDCVISNIDKPLYTVLNKNEQEEYDYLTKGWFDNGKTNLSLLDLYLIVYGNDDYDITTFSSFVSKPAQKYFKWDFLTQNSILIELAQREKKLIKNIKYTADGEMYIPEKWLRNRAVYANKLFRNHIMDLYGFSEEDFSSSGFTTKALTEVEEMADYFDFASVFAKVVDTMDNIIAEILSSKKPA